MILAGGEGWHPGVAGEGVVDGVDGAVSVVAGAGEVGAHGAEPAQGGRGVPVAGDFLVQFGAFQRLLRRVVRPGHGEHCREQPHLAGFVGEACGEGVAGMPAFAVPVAVPVGGLSPGDSLVVAGTKTAQQYGVEFGGCGDLRGLDGGVGLGSTSRALPAQACWVGCRSRTLCRWRKRWATHC